MIVMTESPIVSDAVRLTADFELATALAEGLTNAEAAERCGITDRTVRRRLQIPEFRAEVERLQAGRWENAVRQLSATATKAVATLAALLGEDSERPGANIRLRAAMAVVEFVHELQQNADLDRRLRELEQDSAARKRLRSA